MRVREEVSNETTNTLEVYTGVGHIALALSLKET